MTEQDRIGRHETAIRLNDAAGDAHLSGDLARLAGDYARAVVLYRWASDLLIDTATLVATASASAVLVGRAHELQAIAARMESLALLPADGR